MIMFLRGCGGRQREKEKEAFLMNRSSRRTGGEIMTGDIFENFERSKICFSMYEYRRKRRRFCDFLTIVGDEMEAMMIEGEFMIERIL